MTMARGGEGEGEGDGDGDGEGSTHLGLGDHARAGLPDEEVRQPNVAAQRSAALAGLARGCEGVGGYGMGGAQRNAAEHRRVSAQH
jgi:hypothetical protein